MGFVQSEKESKDINQIRIKKRFGYFGSVFPITVRLPATDPQTAANYLAPFFIADRSYEVIETRTRYETKETTTTTLALQINKVPNGTAPASGTNILFIDIPLTGTANTNIIKTEKNSGLKSAASDRLLTDGDALCLELSGSPNEIAGLTTTIYLKAI